MLALLVGCGGSSKPSATSSTTVASSTPPSVTTSSAASSSLARLDAQAFCDANLQLDFALANAKTEQQTQSGAGDDLAALFKAEADEIATHLDDYDRLAATAPLEVSSKAHTLAQAAHDAVARGSGEGFGDVYLVVYDYCTATIPGFNK